MRDPQVRNRRLSTVQCPAHEVRYDSSGVILSPGWPESYPNLQMCSWSVTVEKGYNVTITFESFHTEREFDVLEIFDGKVKKKKRGACVFIAELFGTDQVKKMVPNLIRALSDLSQVRQPTAPLWQP